LWPRLIARWPPAYASVVCWRMQDTASARRFDRVSRHAGWFGPLASLVTSRCIRSVCSSFGRLPKFGVSHVSATCQIFYDPSRRHAGQCQVENCELAQRDQRSAESQICCCPRAHRRRTPQRIWDKGQQHLPGDEAWLIGEQRASGEKKYYLA